MLDKSLRDTLRKRRKEFYKFISNWYFESEDEDTRQDFEDTYRANAVAPIPTYDEMRKEIFDAIKEMGLRYDIVDPCEANCVVRIYRKEMPIDGKPAGLCGAVCFVRDFLGRWTTIDRDGNVEKMTHGRFYKVTYWTSLLTKYDTPVNANYFDIYVRVYSI